MKAPAPILAIAERVRARVLKQVQARYNEWDLSAYNISVKSMRGLCAIASNELVVELHRAGYSGAVLCCGWHSKGAGGHCWVWLDDKIIDITATQFGARRRVLVTGVDDPKYRVVHVGCEALLRMRGRWHGQDPLFFQSRTTIERKTA